MVQLNLAPTPKSELINSGRDYFVPFVLFCAEIKAHKCSHDSSNKTNSLEQLFKSLIPSNRVINRVIIYEERKNGSFVYGLLKSLQCILVLRKSWIYSCTTRSHNVVAIINMQRPRR